MNKTEKTLEKQTIYEGKMISLYRDKVLCPNGKQSYREVVAHPGGVCVLPLDESGNVILVRQYRYPFGEEITEAPAGKLNKGEDPEAAGVRELQQETGLVAGEMRSLGKCYPSVGYTDEVIYLYLAQNLTQGEICPDEDEFIDTVTLPLQDAVKRVLDGRLSDAKTCIILLKAHALLKG